MNDWDDEQRKLANRRGSNPRPGPKRSIRERVFGFMETSHAVLRWVIGSFVLVGIVFIAWLFCYFSYKANFKIMEYIDLWIK